MLYADETEFGWPVLADEGHEIYALYGLVRTSFAKAWLSPRTVRYYLRAAFRGKRLHRPTGDTLQLGGDFLIDPAGRVVFAFRSAEPADRPSVERILYARTAGSRREVFKD